MSRTARLQVVAPDPINAARSAVERAASATTAARVALDGAREAEAAAVAAFDADDALAEAAGRATAARGKAERLLARRQDEEQTARGELRALERAGDEREFEEALAYVEGFVGRLLPHLDELTTIRERVWTIREAIADEVAKTQGIFDHAHHLAAKLEKPAELARRASRVTILDAQLFANAAVASADKRAARDSCDGWVDAVGPEAVKWNDPRHAAIVAATRTIETLKGQR